MNQVMLDQQIKYGQKIVEYENNKDTKSWSYQN